MKYLQYARRSRVRARRSISWPRHSPMWGEARVETFDLHSHRLSKLKDLGWGFNSVYYGGLTEFWLIAPSPFAADTQGGMFCAATIVG